MEGKPDTTKRVVRPKESSPRASLAFGTLEVLGTLAASLEAFRRFCIARFGLSGAGSERTHATNNRLSEACSGQDHAADE
jgi:hypothetical protein